MPTLGLRHDIIYCAIDQHPHKTIFQRYTLDNISKQLQLIGQRRKNLEKRNECLIISKHYLTNTPDGTEETEGTTNRSQISDNLGDYYKKLSNADLQLVSKLIYNRNSGQQTIYNISSEIIQCYESTKHLYDINGIDVQCKCNTGPHLHVICEYTSSSHGWYKIINDSINEQRQALRTIVPELNINPDRLRRRRTKPGINCYECAKQYICAPPKYVETQIISNPEPTGNRPCNQSNHANPREQQRLCEYDIEFQQLGSTRNTTNNDSSEDGNGNGSPEPANTETISVWDKYQAIVEIIQQTNCNSISTLQTELISRGMANTMLRRDFLKNADCLLQSVKILIKNLTWEDILFKHLPNSNFFDCLSIDESWEWINKILDFNNIQKDSFFENLKCIMDKLEPKRNTICFLGAANAGKTLLAESICRSTIHYVNIQNMDCRNTFYLQDALHCRSMLLNEPKLDDGKFETMKNVFEGQSVTIDKKYCSSMVLDRTPVLIATNQPLALYTRNPGFNETTLATRIWYYKLQPFRDLVHCKRKINPLVWQRLYK